jgi:hypothetical protein
MAVTAARDTTETRTEKGISLARGPALILGTILLAAGLYFLYKQHNFPKFSNFPNGDAPVDGKVFAIFGANGWTGMLTAVAGGLLLFGAAQHLLAKTISLIVGVALGAAAIIAAISGNVLGMAAANGWTEVAWGVAAAILLLNTLVPRRRRTVAVVGDPPGGGVSQGTGVRQPVVATRRRAEPVEAGTGTAVADREGGAAEEPTVADREGGYAEEPTETGAARPASGEETYAGEGERTAHDPEAEVPGA